jgi:hypothetical protein
MVVIAVVDDDCDGGLSLETGFHLRISKDARAWTMRCFGADFRVRRLLSTVQIVKGCDSGSQDIAQQLGIKTTYVLSIQTVSRIRFWIKITSSAPS